MQLHNRRVFAEAILDLAERGITKPRNVLPIKHSSSTLRYIRRMACVTIKTPAGAKAVDIPNCGYAHSDYVLGANRTNPCSTCARPGISLRNFSATLFGIKPVRKGMEQHAGELVVDESAIRRWMNERAAMQPHVLRQAIGIAFAQGWITLVQAAAMYENQIARETSSNVLLRLLRRLRERASFRRDKTLRERDVQAIATEWQEEFESRL